MNIPVAIRTRSEGDWHKGDHAPKMEMRRDGLVSSLTSVTKDNLQLEIYDIGMKPPC